MNTAVNNSSIYLLTPSDLCNALLKMCKKLVTHSGHLAYRDWFDTLDTVGDIRMVRMPPSKEHVPPDHSTIQGTLIRYSA